MGPAPLSAHHWFSANFDSTKPFTLTGTVVRFAWANPHVVLTLETQTKGEYSVEWGEVSQLARTGITAVPVKEGDRLIVTGSINRNPEKRILTLVQEISRPADGWYWENPNRPNPSSTTK